MVSYCRYSIIPLSTDSSSAACFAVVPEVPTMETGSAGIKTHHRIVKTVGKHVITDDTLSSRHKCIGIDESAYFGIVITGLEVI